MSYEDALDSAFDLAGQSDALERFLATQPRWRSRLEADLALLAELAGLRLRPSQAGREGARRRLETLVAELPSQTAAAKRSPAFEWLRRPRLRLGGLAAAALAAVLIIALVTLPGGGSDRLVTVEGRLALVEPGSLTLQSADGTQKVSYDASARLLDGFGNPIRPALLQPGQPVVLSGRRSDVSLVAEQVELKDRLFGTVLSIDASTARIRSGTREFAVQIVATTELHGGVSAGAFVEVEVQRLADGSLVARELETADDDNDD